MAIYLGEKEVSACTSASNSFISTVKFFCVPTILPLVCCLTCLEASDCCLLAVLVLVIVMINFYPSPCPVCPPDEGLKWIRVHMWDLRMVSIPSPFPSPSSGRIRSGAAHRNRTFNILNSIARYSGGVISKANMKLARVRGCTSWEICMLRPRW